MLSSGPTELRACMDNNRTLKLKHGIQTCHVMSLPVTTYPFPWGRGMLLLEPIPALSQGEGRVLPGQVASSSQGPYWWAMWGSVSCSRTLQHAAQPCPEPGFEPATFRCSTCWATAALTVAINWNLTAIGPTRNSDVIHLIINNSYDFTSWVRNVYLCTEAHN